MSTTTAYAAIEHHLALLYEGAPDDAFLVLSYPQPDTNKPKAEWDWQSRWFRSGQARDTAIQQALQWTADYDVYYGVCLRHPTCKPSPFRRGTKEEVFVVPGLWGDWDVATGNHKAGGNLPSSLDALLQFLSTLPAAPSLMIATGGGLHTYHLFREPWLIQNETDRWTISRLSARFQYTVHSWAKEQHGWDMTILADLPRVLRLPGCRNHKYADSEVEVLHEDARRYNLDDFDEWLLELEQPATVERTHPNIGVGSLNLQTLAEHYGVKLEKKSAHELAGAHPVHGSDTGSNLNINLAKGLWHCWRHLKGGDAVHFLAMCEGLISCDAMRGGVLRGDLFKQVVQIANRKFQAGIKLDASQRRNGSMPGPEPPDPSVCPELPAYAKTDEQGAARASLFLDDYIAFSRKWAPRAYDGFHEAVALFLLSTIAARRIKIEFGPRGIYTSIYIALAARTTIFTKTTTTDIGIALLDAAGLGWLLADDDATPQAFLRSLSLYVPSNYSTLSPDEQATTRLQLAFAGQKGWYYEEWGQHLEAMMQKNGYMAAFRGILRRLDDHKARYVYGTISRGRDIVRKPYLTVLANVTPADLQPFVRTRSPLWRDGYIARVAFVVPDTTDGSEAEFPEGSPTFPSYFMTSLQSWHKRLGVPSCSLTPIYDKKGKDTGTYEVQVSPLPEKTYTLSPDVRKAFYAYDRAMRELTRQRKDEDLDGSYGRFPIKALRIAGLLASLHDDGDRYTIWPAQWWRAQQIAEHWRRDLHRLMKQVATTPALSQDAQHERRVLDVLRQRGPLTIRDIHRWTKLPYVDITQHCATLVAAQILTEEKTARATKYRCTEEEAC